MANHANGGGYAGASTQYTIANDTKNLVIYYHTMFNRGVRKLDLKKMDFSKKGLCGIPLDKKRAQDIEEVGAELR